MKKSFLIIAILLVTVLLSGCKPYDTPEFVDIQPNETAFLVPLEGKTGDQASFDSEAFLSEAKIATKRVQIPHKWIQTGRAWFSGHYVGTMRVIIVDRSPETREWTAESKQGISVRSKDGIGFTVGISATSSILEEDSARFLYMTSGSRTLADVMDSEVRNRIETKLIEEFAKNDMEFINQNKGVIMERVSEDIIGYFKKERGITISNLGYKGDIVFDDPGVQESMNVKFIVQQRQEADAIRKETDKNNSLAEIEVKRNEADALIVEAQGIAEANRKIQESLTVELLYSQYIGKWDGVEPRFKSGNEANWIFDIGNETGK